MRHLAIMFAAISLMGCGPVTTVSEPPSIEMCEEAIYQNMFARSLSHNQTELTSLVLASSARQELEQAMGPGVTVAEYCATKSPSEIRSMIIEAERAISVYANIRGISQTVAEDSINRRIEDMRRNNQERAEEEERERNRVRYSSESNSMRSSNFDRAVRHAIETEDWSSWTPEECDEILIRHQEVRAACFADNSSHALERQLRNHTRPAQNEGVTYPDNPSDIELDNAIRRTAPTFDWSGWTRAECYAIGPEYGDANRQCVRDTVVEDDRRSSIDPETRNSIETGLEIARRLENVTHNSSNQHLIEEETDAIHQIQKIATRQ